MGIVGAVILTGAMIAVFYYESSNATVDDGIVGTGANLYTVQWQEETHEATSDGQKATGGESIQMGEGNAVTYDVAIPNYTSMISVHLVWSDDMDTNELNGEDTFKVELLGPDGSVLMEDDADTGDLWVNHTVRETEPVSGEPAQMTVQARGNDTAEAEQAVKDAAGSETYKIRVTLASTNTQVPDPLPGEVRDTQNDFTYYLGYTHWHAWEESNLPEPAAE